MLEHRLLPTDVMYQAYIRTFMDGNGDGIGDLAGIISRLDHLHWLGVRWLWINPFFPSTADEGYAVSDYMAIDRMFGNLDDFRLLVQEARKRGIGILIDLVVSHTSDQHPWFLASSAGDPQFKDFYHWHPGYVPGKVPNNWLSTFCGSMPEEGSAWKRFESRGMWNLHLFLPSQPTLNWMNQKVRQAMAEVLRWWFRLGAMGARIDVPDWAGVDLWQWTDNPPNPAYNRQEDPDWYHSQLHLYDQSMPWVVEVYRLLDDVARQFPGRIIVTETYANALTDPVTEHARMFRRHTRGLSAPFILGLPYMPFTAQAVGSYLESVARARRPGDMGVLVAGNHDVGRMGARVPQHLIRAAATIQLTWPGPVCIFGGEETGLPAPDDLPETLMHDERRHWGKDLARDRFRTPPIWDNTINGGFTSSRQPYLPAAQDTRTYSVSYQRGDAQSVLHLYRHLIALRHREPRLSSPDFALVRFGAAPDVFACARGNGVYVFANLGPERAHITTGLGRGVVLASSTMERSRRQISLSCLKLDPGQALVASF